MFKVGEGEEGIVSFDLENISWKLENVQAAFGRKLCRIFVVFLQGLHHSFG